MNVYTPPPWLRFTDTQRAAAQAWHDANDMDEQHLTVNQRAEQFRRTWAESARLKAAAREKLSRVPPCAHCGAKAGQPGRDPDLNK